MDAPGPNSRDRHSGDRHSGDGNLRKGFRGTAENAKTQVCMRWLNGDCRFGDRCNFAHGEHELRALPFRSGGRGRGRGGARGRRPSRTTYLYHPQMMQASTPGNGPGPTISGRGLTQDSIPDMSPNVWAASGYPLAGANGWVMYRVPESGEPYYHHAEMNKTQWDQPPDFIQR